MYRSKNLLLFWQKRRIKILKVFISQLKMWTVTRTNHDFDHSILDMQPQKKAKYHPFTWFQTDNSTTLSTTNKITNIDSLVKYSCISKKWFQNERISTYLTGGIIINFNTHYCRRLPCNYWSFRHPHQRARGILVPLMLYI